MSELQQSTLNHALALLALNSPPGSPEKTSSDQEMIGEAIARLTGRGFEYTMRKPLITVGRNRIKGNVDVNMGRSNLISREHLEIFVEHRHFFMKCKSKNGIFIDGLLKRKGPPTLQLPRSCILRFPSTDIKIQFKSLIDEGAIAPPPTADSLRIDVPEPMEFGARQFLLPTGSFR